MSLFYFSKFQTWMSNNLIIMYDLDIIKLYVKIFYEVYEMKNVSLEGEIARYVVRKRRIKEKELTLDDLKCLDISKSTVSNIENGKAVRHDYFELYLSKLDLTKKDLDLLIHSTSEEIKELTFHLDAVEAMLEDGNIRSAQALLQDKDIDEFHPLSPWYFFLQGYIYEKHKDYKNAEKKHLEAIQMHNKYNLNPSDNIVARCFNSLGICSFFQSQYGQAIDYINQGLEAYDGSKEMKEIKYKLIINKILYLMNASRNDEAFLILNEVWPYRSQIDKNNGALLDFYSFRAIFLRNRGMFQEAMEVCEEGFYILKSIRSQNRYLDLLNILGSIHLYRKEFDTAYDRFHLALSTDLDVKYPRRQIETHTWLGILHNCKQEWDKAIDHLNQAITISRDVPNPRGLTKALIVMGNTYFLQEKYLEAIPFYEEAMAMCEQYGYKHRQYSALLKKSNCIAKMGKTEDPNFIDCLKQKFQLEIEIHLQSEDEAYEID